MVVDPVADCVFILFAALMIVSAPAVISVFAPEFQFILPAVAVSVTSFAAVNDADANKIFPHFQLHDTLYNVGKFTKTNFVFNIIIVIM